MHATRADLRTAETTWRATCRVVPVIRIARKPVRRSLFSRLFSVLAYWPFPN